MKPCNSGLAGRSRASTRANILVNVFFFPIFVGCLNLQHLDQVLQAVEESGITLSPSKCHFFYSSILLLGHKVSRLGLSTHEAKIEAIDRLAAPTNIPSLRTFLGMAVYFSAFIPYYSFTVAPLFKLLRQGLRMNTNIAKKKVPMDVPG